ncbi:MAG: hypothetical protein H8Z69_04230 [Nanohaloarchaea archaeon]|nr:hypothetical protein [Candidatus Nanohaloarchaea archaeon]
MADFVEQEYLDETADELEFYTGEVESRLEMYDEGEVDEEHVKRPAEKAKEVYEELDEALDEVSEQLQEHDVIDEFGELLEEHGYDSGAEFLAGQRPVTAGDEDPERQVMEDFTENDWPDTENAYDAKRRYLDVRKAAYEEHGIELPSPDIDINPEHREIMELVEEGMSVKDAREEVTGERSWTVGE